jgi:predicted Zn-dependent protease
MTETRRQATVAVAAAFAILVAPQASAQDEPTAATGQRQGTIVLHVVNYAALSRDVLDETRARVASIYEVIGVRIVWDDSEEPVRTNQDAGLHLTVMLLSRGMTEKKISAEGISDFVFGQAHLPSGRAHIFYDRIATMSGASGFLPLRLGDVIAHEVGHLVLTTTSHSHSGIMRANMDMRNINAQSFDTRQARTIHTALMQPRSGVTGR